MAESTTTDTWPPARQAWFAAFMLAAANTFAFVDRQALALLVQPIKEDLQVSDTAMSLLYGLSFTMFYVLVGIPVARLADRANRRNIVAAAIFIWSLATALCGLARSFGMLFVARIGVGAGEGGSAPPPTPSCPIISPSTGCPRPWASIRWASMSAGRRRCCLGAARNGRAAIQHRERAADRRDQRLAYRVSGARPAGPAALRAHAACP